MLIKSFAFSAIAVIVLVFAFSYAEAQDKRIKLAQLCPYNITVYQWSRLVKECQVKLSTNVQTAIGDCKKSTLNEKTDCHRAYYRICADKQLISKVTYPILTLN